MKLLNLLLFNFIQATTLFDAIQTIPAASNFLQGLNQTQEKQNLANILKNYSNITIFLPTNDAINNLSQVKNISNAGESEIFYYHIALGILDYAKLKPLQYMESVIDVNNYTQKIKITKIDDVVKVLSGAYEPAILSSPNVTASNGVVYLIDRWLTPPASVTETLRFAKLNEFNKLIKNTTVEQDLIKGSNFTIFVPTDEAILKFKHNNQDLTSTQIVDKLRSHILPKVLYSYNFKDGLIVPSLNGQITFAIKDGSVTLGGSKLIMPGILTNNGVIHVIDSVISEAPDPKKVANSANSLGQINSNLLGLTIITSLLLII